LSLDLLSHRTQATQEVSLYLMEDLSMLCSVYPPLEELEEVLHPANQVELESEELDDLAQEPEDLEAQELEVQVELESASALVPEVLVVLAVLEVEVLEALEVQVDLCSTES